MVSIQLEEALVEDVRRRAASEGMTVTDLVTDVLRRALERVPQEESIIAYDRAGEGSFEVEREPGEDNASYERRTALYRDLFVRS
jgi:hypothetical protein